MSALRSIKPGYYLPILLLLACLIHIGGIIKGGLYADDYLHAALFLGEPQLEDKGLLDGLGAKSLWGGLTNQFNFFDPASPNYQALVDFGTLPWWINDDAKLHFFRPLASLTHWLDYQLWPTNTHLMHAMSMVWYLLGLIAIFLCYRRFGLSHKVAAASLLLVILDVSTFFVLGWIASRSMLMIITLGFACLYAYHRSVQSVSWYLISLLLLLLALLSAEGAIGICLYLAAFTLTYDTRPWLKRLLAIAPFAILTLIWRYAYIKAGFGAANLDFYIDPGLNPEAFLARAGWFLPVNFFELVSGIDILSAQIHPEKRILLAIPGFIIWLLITWLLLQPLKENRTLRFFYFASLLSLIPSLTITLSSRTLILPNIGFTVVIVWLMRELYYRRLEGVKKIAGIILTGFLLFLHLICAFGISLYLTITQLQTSKPTSAETELPFDLANRTVVFLTANKPFWLAFLGHELARESKPLPHSIRLIASDFYPVTVRRIDQKTLEVTADPAFQLNTQLLTNESHSGHFAFQTLRLMGLLRTSDQPFQTGPARDFDDLAIRIKETKDGNPQTLELHLKPGADYLWLYWNKKTATYEELDITQPENHLPGIFQRKTGSDTGINVR